MVAPLAILNGDITVQTFADHSGAVGHPEIRHGTLDSLSPWLKRKNQDGHGVHYTVNQTDGQGRKASNITGIRAYFCDVDGIPAPEIKSEVISTALMHDVGPSAIVETKNGVHMLWYVHNAPVDPEHYTHTVEGIIQYWRGDNAAKNISRTLRLPGYNHQKDPQDPFEVWVVYEDANLFYSPADIRAAFPPPPKTRRAPVTPVTGSSALSNEAWAIIYQSLCEWVPVDGIKHRVLMVSLGVAKKFGVPEADALRDITALHQSWHTRDGDDKVLSNLRWAYHQGQACTVSGLRSLGVPVPKLPRPSEVDNAAY